MATSQAVSKLQSPQRIQVFSFGHHRGKSPEQVALSPNYGYVTWLAREIGSRKRCGGCERPYDWWQPYLVNIINAVACLPVSSDVRCAHKGCDQTPCYASVAGNQRDGYSMDIGYLYCEAHSHVRYRYTGILLPIAMASLDKSPFVGKGDGQVTDRQRFFDSVLRPALAIPDILTQKRARALLLPYYEER